MIINCSGVSV
jgi:hypothetical protein